MFPLQEDEKINVVLPVAASSARFPPITTSSWRPRRAWSRRRALDEFSNPRKAGIIAVDLDDGDYLIGAALTDGKHDVMLFSDGGKAVRFDENDVRPMGRSARGVRGMTLEGRPEVIAMLVAEDETQSVLTATENGYGKRTPIVEYTRHGRGTKGMIAIQQIGAQRQGRRRDAGRRRRRDHADHRRGRAGAHARHRDPRARPRDAGRDADHPRRRREAVGPADASIATTRTATTAATAMATGQPGAGSGNGADHDGDSGSGNGTDSGNGDDDGDSGGGNGDGPAH